MENIGGSSSKDRVPFKAAIDRSSKKLITDNQSTHVVLYNDDLLIDILLRLPVISLFQLKSVCKRWLSLITDPTFNLRRSQVPTLDPPCGAIIQPWSWLDEYYFVSFNIRIPCKSSILKNPFTFGSKLPNVKILQSCNGLLLLQANREYCVYNPCINLLKMVPQCSNKTVYSTNIAFNPIKSPHYKVIQAVSVNDAADYGIWLDDTRYCQIQTYSSEAETWSVCTGPYRCHNFNHFDDGICWNDELYWPNFKKFLLMKLGINLEYQTLTTIKYPRTLEGKEYRPDFKLFETCGCLLLLCRRYGYPLLMDVYEMRKGYPEWLVKYHLDLNDDVSYPRRSWPYPIEPIVCSIVLGEREEDSFIVIKSSTKIFQYKPVLKTSHDLYDLDPLHHSIAFNSIIASFAGVGL